MVNPDMNQLATSQLDLVVAGTDEAIMMVEAGAENLSESVMLEALELAHREIKKIVVKVNELRDKVGCKKRVIEAEPLSEELQSQVKALAASPIREAVFIPDKAVRQERLDEILRETIEKLGGEDSVAHRQIKDAYHDLEYDEVRDMILEKKVRADGRGPSDIRPITCETGILPRTHGSAIFTRGETQALAVVTLGTADDEQRIDALEGEYFRSFMLHYNFPPFSVGEARPMRAPGRREIGHGKLAERALKSVMPTKETFPYTIRLVSDILESNGSSSMATVCGLSLIHI